MNTSLLSPVALLGIALSTFPLSCGGSSVKAETRVGANVEVFDFDRPLAEEKIEQGGDKQQKKTMAALSQAGTSSARPSANAALLGARHDVRLAPDVTTPKCQCLAALVGGANTPGLAWAGPAPQLDARTQLVVAFGSEGIPCARSSDGQVASYRGYAVEGSDVVVTVELARSGRPVTHGAVVPRPAAGGQLYVRPATQQVPFGRALDGAPRCALGAGAP